jgi:hypothetical protein
MGLFDRLRLHRVPAWAQGLFSPSEWRRFRDLVVRELPAGEFTDDESRIAVEIHGRTAVLGLANLARECVASSNWAATIASWFQRAPGEVELALRLAHGELTWDDSAPRLRVQLYNGARVMPGTLAREVANDLYLVVVLDSERSMARVQHDRLAAWQQSEDAVFERAIANLRASSIAVEWSAGSAPSPLLIAASDNDYGSAVTFLSLAERALAGHGALVIFATRFTTAVLPVGSSLSEQALAKMLAGAHALYETGEGPLSPRLYWWCDGKLAEIPTTTRPGDDGLLIHWPPELEPLVRAGAPRPGHLQS